MNKLELINLGNYELSAAYDLLKAISRAQEHVIREDAPSTLFEDLLNDLLTLTKSEYGNMGEVLVDHNGQRYMKTHACCNIAWNDATRRLYEESLSNGMIFRRLDSLYGSVMTTGQMVISGSPTTDSRRCGLPEGHPALNSYLGLPVYHAGQLVAMVGLANRPDGYDQALVDYLQPLIASYGRVIAHYRLEQQKREVTRSLEESQRYARLLADYLGIISGLSQRAVAEATLSFLHRQLGPLRFSIALLDNNGGSFHLYAVEGEMQNAAPAGVDLPLNETLLSELVTAHAPRYVPDLAAEAASYANEQRLIAAGVRSAYYVPLWIEDRFLGTLNMGASELNGFSEEIRRFVPLLAPSLAQAMHSAKLFDALQHSEQHNRMLFENAVTGLALCCKDGKLVDVNQAYANILGYSVEETLQLNDWAITPSCHHPVQQSRLEELERLGWCRPFEKEYLHKQGHLVPVRMTGMRLGKDGKPCILFSVQDIAEEKHAAQALTRFRAALDCTVDNVLLIDPATSKFVDCNASALQRMGYSREELLTLGPCDIMPELPVETVHHVVEQVLSGAQEYVEYSTVHLCRDGSLFPVEVRLSKLSDAKGQPLLIAMVRDITERKQAEEKYLLLAAVVENTAEGVLISDTQNRIVAVNKAFTAITGYEEGEVLGKNPSIVRSGRYDQAFYAELWNKLKEQGVWQGELWDRRKNGELFPTWSTISAVFDHQHRITNYVSIFSDISSIKQSQEKLDFLAHHDPLTHLPNRLLLNDRLDHALQRAQREGHQVAVLFLDLDRFKNVNDSLGHPIGDELLIEAAKRIKEVIRLDDTVGRLGGDEFIIVMECIEEVQHVAVLAQKLMQGFARPFMIKDHELHLTLSMGISLYPRDGEDSATLIRNADAAMYRAKEEGRNDYQFYTAALTTAVFERLTLETALRQALEGGQLVLYYQPQYCLASSRLSGAEALVRWQHPQMGVVAPDKFIPLAEETGLILRLGDWVLTQACQQARQWQHAGHAFNRVSVNVSGLQFQRGDIVASVRNALTNSGLEARHLELEITESFIMQKAELAINTLNTLKEIGVTIAIDDFGTGYSSLSYLKRLPIDKLKIDRSFVRDIPQDSNDAAITEAVLALGHSLRLGVVAEGVETVEQQDFLRRLDCTEVQGHLYSRPLPAAEFERLLAQA